MISARCTEVSKRYPHVRSEVIYSVIYPAVLCCLPPYLFHIYKPILEDLHDENSHIVYALHSSTPPPPPPTMDDPNPELESFRQQWRREVTARVNERTQTGTGPDASIKTPSTLPRSKASTKSSSDDQEQPSGSKPPTESAYHEPETALEHYEKGVEKESQGVLGDSLTHYRIAYKVRVESDASTIKVRWLTPAP